jgi:alanine racemase
VLAIVKANAYGHGAVWAARELNDADAFGVASIEEALALREGGITKPITVLEGFFDVSELPLFAQHDLWCVVHDEAQLLALENARLARKLSVWIKLDTGMHRLGFEPAQFAAVSKRLRACANIADIRAMTHFASADDLAAPQTRAQLESFFSQVKDTGLELSIANSAGVLAWPEAIVDWVRPGIMLYGCSPFGDKAADSFNLHPVMTLTSALMTVNLRRRGEPIGYSGEYHCPEDMPVGVAAIGYGDGYPRRMPAGTPVLLNGKPVPIVGRVSMDMITLDLRSQPQAKPGDPVVLWGAGLSADVVAQQARTVSYELFCQVTPRVTRAAK